jgi:hypothetical protein
MSQESQQVGDHEQISWFSPQKAQIIEWAAGIEPF